MADASIFVGYQGGQAVYRVLFAAGTLTSETFQAKAWHAGDIAAVIQTIDRVCFYEPGDCVPAAPKLPNPFWMLPLVVSGYTSMKVAPGGGGVSTLTAQCQIRSWIEDQQSFVRLQFSVSVQTGALVFESVQIASYSYQHFWTPISAPVGPFSYTSAALLTANASQSFPQKSPAGFVMSQAGKEIGLADEGGTQFDYRLECAWSFESDATVDSDLKSILLVFNKPVLSTTRAMSVHGFGIDIDPKQLEQINPFGTDQTTWPTPILNFAQRQPRGFTQQTFLQATTWPWRFSVKIPHASAATLFNGTVGDRVLNSLDEIQAGSVLSFLPTLDDQGPWFWNADFVIEEPAAAQDPPKLKFAAPGTKAPPRWPIWARQLTPASDLDGVNVTLPGLQTTAPAPLQLTTALALVDGQDALAEVEVPDASPSYRSRWAYSFQMRHRAPTPGAVSPSAQVVKMGALDLIFFPSSSDATAAGVPIGNPDPTVDAGMRVQAWLDANGNVVLRDVQYVLCVVDLVPGGQDALPDDPYFNDLGSSFTDSPDYTEAFQRSQPLVFRTVAPNTSGSEAAYTLKIRERTSTSSNQTVQATLRIAATAPKGYNASRLDSFVIDAEPFLVAKISAQSLADQYNAITSEIGHWSNEPGVDGWQLSAGAGGFTLTLPPQGIGEAMHKRTGEDDIEPGEPIDFRFTPATVVNLQASLLQRRFAEAPWNLRSILGYAGQETPGAQMTRAQFELFYGLSVDIGQPNARLAEMGSLIGSFAGAQPPTPTWNPTSDQETLYTAQRTNWATLQPRLRSRLAALQPWRDDMAAALSFDASNQVQITIRDNAHLRAPVPSPADSLQSLYFKSTGLPGGWSWGFESNNILNAVLQNKKSFAAEIHDLIFSALGGSGHQKASFDRGLTTIYCHVAIGRVESITIERIGRIEPFWNRAKHVIVYRRTVAATRQFYLEQIPFRGSPILRKTEEYVELIEQERGFPDSNTPVQNRGFLLGCRFDGKPPRIPVDSRWGDDVSTIGWQVPLWRRDAAPSDVYPRPEIGLLFAGRNRDEVLKHSIANPEIVRFYTDTVTTASASTDDWPAVEGISFAQVNPDNFKNVDYTTNDAMTQPSAIAPGSGNFTFLLDTAPAASNIVVDRAANPIGAAITNVTVMRGYVAGTPSATPLSNAQALREQVTNAIAPAVSVLNYLGSPQGPSAPATPITTVLKDVAAGFGTLSTNATNLLGATNPPADAIVANDISRRLLSQFDLFAQPIKTDILSVFNAIGSQCLSAFSDIQNDTEWASSGDPALNLILLGGAKGRLRDQLEVLWSGEQGVLDQLAGIRGLGANSAAAIDAAIEQMEEAGVIAAMAFAEARLTLLALPDHDQTGAQLLAIFDPMRDAVEEQLRRIDFLAGDPVQHWVGTQTNSVRLTLAIGLRSLRDRLLDLRTQAALAAGNPATTIADGLTTQAASFGTLIDQVTTQMAQDWGGPLSADASDPNSLNPSIILAPFESLWATVQSDIGTFIETKPDWASLIADVTKYFLTFVDGLEQKLEDLLAQVRTALQAYAARIWKTLAQKLLPDLTSLAKDIEGFVTSGNALAFLNRAGLDTSLLRDELQKLEDGIVAALDSLAERIRLYHMPIATGLPALSGDGLLRLLRAFGEPPRVPGLDFSLPNVTFPFSAFQFFDLHNLPSLLPNVSLSPILSAASGLLSFPGSLNPMNLTMPSVGLLDRLQPPDLTALDLSSVFNNWGGLELKNLFPDLKMPQIAQQNIHITHGVEPTTRSAWLQADADVPFADHPIDVFSLAGIHMRLLQARFRGSSRIDTPLGQTPRQTTSGSITGDWEISIGGLQIATLVNCSVIYTEGGNLTFDISLDRVKLDSVLEFLEDLMSSMAGDSGFVFTINQQGAVATLNIPLPDIQSGTFGLTNLNLGFYFALNFFGGFTLSTGLNISRRTAPFTLTIFILGGAGFFESDITYKPGSPNEFSTRVSAGMFAAASFAISLGPISGGIYAYFGITADFSCTHDAPATLDLRIVLLFRGEVSLLGFISVSLVLSLEASYQTGGRLSGRGSVEYHIKIGWFIDIHVSAAVEYGFGGASSKSKHNLEAQTAPNHKLAAQRSAAMFVAR